MSDQTSETSQVTETFHVQGMTCGHCAQAVRGELVLLPGVTEVAVDVESGAVTVTSADRLDGDAVRAAVDEAGYEVVTPQ